MDVGDAFAAVFADLRIILDRVGAEEGSVYVELEDTSGKQVYGVRVALPADCEEVVAVAKRALGR